MKTTTYVQSCLLLSVVIKKKPTNINIIPYFKMQSRIEIITFLEMKTILASQNIAKIKGAIVNFY